MKDQIDRADLLEIQLAATRADNAKLQLALVERDVQAIRERLIRQYEIGEHDDVDMASGKIKRAPVEPPPAEPEP